MIPKIKSIKPLKGYLLHVVFDDGKDCIYDVNDDINTIKGYEDLKNVYGLFNQVQCSNSTHVLEKKINFVEDVYFIK